MTEAANKSNAKPRRMPLDDEHQRAAQKQINQPSEYEKLSLTEKATVQEWIAARFVESKIPSKKTSYTFKHRFADSPGGFYMTNGAMKGAMAAAGFEEAYQDGPNADFFAEYKPPKGEKK